MGEKSRRKGANFERKIAKALTEALGVEFRRTPLSGGWADSSQVAGDIVPIENFDFPFSLECKNVEGWTLESLFNGDDAWLKTWWEQCVNETPEGKTPLLIFTKNYAPTFVMGRVFDTFIISNMGIEGVLHIYIGDETCAIFSFDKFIRRLKELDKSLLNIGSV